MDLLGHRPLQEGRDDLQLAQKPPVATTKANIDLAPRKYLGLKYSNAIPKLKMRWQTPSSTFCSTLRTC